MNIVTMEANVKVFRVVSPEDVKRQELFKKYRYLLNSVPGVFLLGISSATPNTLKMSDILSSSSILSLVQGMRGKVRFNFDESVDTFLVEVPLTLSKGTITVASLNKILPANITASPISPDIDLTLGELSEDVSLFIYLYRPYKGSTVSPVLDPNNICSPNISSELASQILVTTGNVSLDKVIPLSGYSTLLELVPSPTELKLTSYTPIKFDDALTLSKSIVVQELSRLSNSIT